ncbi:hypothetical protein HMPREF0670_00844 [Prevotella sp. oral taxon 317 str. F0108]|nr:hypothetical protein HMPREF0670_00844 [Prevotella sp. oral taxon 317 str. F0108]
MPNNKKNTGPMRLRKQSTGQRRCLLNQPTTDYAKENRARREMVRH